MQHLWPNPFPPCALFGPPMGWVGKVVRSWDHHLSMLKQTSCLEDSEEGTATAEP